MVKHIENNQTIVALTDSERQFFTDVATLLQNGRNKAYATANSIITETYIVNASLASG